MKRTLFLLGILVFYTAILAQEADNNASVPGRSSFFAELGGPGILFSANVDHRFKLSRLGWGGRLGIGFFTTSEDNYDPSTGSYNYRDRSVITIPVQVNYIFGKNNNPHTFEAGAGFTLLGRKSDVFNYYDSARSRLLGTFSFMYRRQPVDGGFSWRIGFTPLVARNYIQPSGAASVGYIF